MTFDPVKLLLGITLVVLLIGGMCGIGKCQSVQCANIREPDPRNYCMAVSSHNLTMCALIRDQSLRGQCVAFAGEKR